MFAGSGFGHGEFRLAQVVGAVAGGHSGDVEDPVFWGMEKVDREADGAWEGGGTG